MKDRIFPPHGRRKHDFLHHIQVPPQKKCVLIQVPSPERRSFLSPSGFCPSCLRCRRRRHRCIGQLESVLRGAHPCLLLWLSRVRFALQSMWLARCMLSCNQALSSCFRALLTAFHAARLAALGGCLCAACRCSRSWLLSRNLCWGGGRVMDSAITRIFGHGCHQRRGLGGGLLLEVSARVSRPPAASSLVALARGAGNKAPDRIVVRPPP